MVRQIYLRTPSVWSLESVLMYRLVFTLALGGNDYRMGVWHQHFPANVRFPTSRTPRLAPATFYDRSTNTLEYA